MTTCKIARKMIAHSFISIFTAGMLEAPVYGGSAGFGENDRPYDPPLPSASPSPPSAKPAEPGASKSDSPSIEQTIDFLHRILPDAASFREILHDTGGGTWKIAGVKVDLKIKPTASDFQFSVRRKWADKFTADRYSFNLSDVKLSGATSSMLSQPYGSKLRGLLLRCEIGSCVEHTGDNELGPAIEERIPQVLLPIAEADVEARLLKALRHLQSFTKRKKDPF
jgi:hypothetical protein